MTTKAQLLDEIARLTTDVRTLCELIGTDAPPAPPITEIDDAALFAEVLRRHRAHDENIDDELRDLMTAVYEFDDIEGIFPKEWAEAVETIEQNALDDARRQGVSVSMDDAPAFVECAARVAYGELSALSELRRACENNGIFGASKVQVGLL